MRTQLFLIVVTLLAVLGCGTDAPPRNIILVVIDTMRADNVGCYAPGANPTPAIDSLAAKGIRFQNCISQAPWTLPSVVTILTGFYPSTHGADGIDGAFSADIRSLAAALRERGYNTGAVVSHTLVGSERGFDRGFDFFDDLNALGHAHVSSGPLTEKGMEWISTAKEPFFLFLHYFDPHFNYIEHAGLTTHEPYRGALQSGMNIWAIRDSIGRYGPDDFQYLRELYAGEVRYVDSQLGRLLDLLEADGTLARTAVVVTGDHGEEFMEHGWLGHTRNLYDNLLQVPLILFLPWLLEPEVRNEPAMLIDIYPTLLSVAGEKELPGPGRNLLSDDREPRSIISEVNYDPTGVSGGEKITQHRMKKRARMRSIRLGKWKAIEDRIENSWELYDIDRDPGETRNLAAENPAALQQLQEALACWADTLEFGEKTRVELSPDDKNELRSLGYIR